jgi:hypothetical protein
MPSTRRHNSIDDGRFNAPAKALYAADRAMALSCRGCPGRNAWCRSGLGGGGSHRHSGRAELQPQKKGPRRRPQLSEVNGTLGTAIQVPGATAVGGSSEVGSVSCPSAATAAPLG